MSAGMGTVLRRTGWIVVAGIGALFAIGNAHAYLTHGYAGYDSHAYWLAARDPSRWYTLAPGQKDAYLYSPAFAQFLWPLGQLPWTAFQCLWTIAQLSVAAWCLAPIGWRRGIAIAFFCMPEFLAGNIYIFMAGALVLALQRTPPALALFALTKVTTGVVGLWFLLRKEWWAATVTLLATAVVIGASVCISPQAWVAWVTFLIDSSGDGGGLFYLRWAAAAALTAWAARSDRAWLLACGLALTPPVFGSVAPLTVLIAIPRLRRLNRTSPVIRPRATANV